MYKNNEHYQQKPSSESKLAEEFKKEQEVKVDNFSRLLDALASSSAYAKIRVVSNSSAEAFSAANDFFSKLPSKGERSPSVSEKSFMKVVSLLSNGVDSSLEINRLNEKEHLSSSEKATIKDLKLEHAIPFNHALKEFINHNPDLSMDSLTSLLERTYSRYCHDENLITGQSRDGYIDSKAIESQMKLTITGMRAELAAETMLIAADVDYRYDISKEEDSKGTDLKVLIDGEWESIDVKSSDLAESRAHEKRSDSRAVWTTLLPKDFTGSKGIGRNCLMIPFETAVQAAPDFIDRVKQVVQESKSSNSTDQLQPALD